jgi:hypothetical protein
MSELVSGGETPGVVAGEYVLGTLDTDERTHAQDLLATNAEFAVKVKVWERRLGELHLMVEPVEPDPAIWDHIKAKLSEVQQEMQRAEPVIAEPAPAQAAPAEPVPAEPGSAEPGPAEPVSDDPSARLDAAIAAISEAASPPVAEAPSQPATEVPSEPVTEAPSPEIAAAEPVAAAPAAETAPSEVAPAEPVAEPSSFSPAPFVPPVIPVPIVGGEERRSRHRVNGWRVLAVLMTLLVLAMAVLVGAWRFAPERVPSPLQPIALLRLIGVSVPTPPPAAPVRRPLPPQSQFDE